jgi:hypothetical protein
MARLPGVKRARAAERFGLSIGMLRRAMKEHAVESIPSAHDLVLHAITDAGSSREGTLPDLAMVASYCDYNNKDGSTVEDVQRRLDELARDGIVEVEGARWRLLEEFP